MMDADQRTILCRHWGHLLAQLCAGLLVLPSLCEEMGVHCSEESCLGLGSGTGCSCTLWENVAAWMYYVS